MKQKKKKVWRNAPIPWVSALKQVICTPTIAIFGCLLLTQKVNASNLFYDFD